MTALTATHRWEETRGGEGGINHDVAVPEIFGVDLALAAKAAQSCWRFEVDAGHHLCDEVYRLAFAAKATQQRGRFELIGGNAGQHLQKIHGIREGESTRGNSAAIHKREMEWTRNAHQTLLYFKTQLPLITILRKFYIPPVLANDAPCPPRLLVEGDQREDTGIIADQNRVHVFIVDVPALAALKACGGPGGHRRCNPQTQCSRQLVSDEQTSLARRLKRGRRLPDV
jgi:hypothetical protein